MALLDLTGEGDPMRADDNARKVLAQASRYLGGVVPPTRIT